MSSRSEIAEFHRGEAMYSAWQGDSYLRRAAGLLELARAWRDERRRSWPEGKCEWPLNTEAPIRAYVDAAYYTGMLTTGGPLGGALLHWYAQLFFPYAKLGREGRLARVVTLPFLRLQDFCALGYFAAREVRYGMTDPDKLLARAGAALLGGGYLLTNVDEFYIPGTDYFLRSHFRHAHLVVGFDSRRRTFRSAVYQRNGTFGVVDVPGSCFIQGLLGASRIGGGKPRIDGVQRATGAPAPFSPPLLRAQLLDYLAGVDNSAEYMGGRFTVPGVTPWNEVTEGYFGRNVYTGYRHYFRSLIGDDYPMDLRATRILMEHKQILRRSLEATPESPAAAAAAARMEEINRLAYTLHLKAWAYNRSYDRNIIFNMIDTIDAIDNTETTVMRGLLAAGYGK